MKYTTFFLCACSILLLGSCKKQPVQNEQPLEVMTFNIRLDAPSDSANNWKYRKDNACKMIAYYQPDGRSQTGASPIHRTRCGT